MKPTNHEEDAIMVRPFKTPQVLRVRVQQEMFMESSLTEKLEWSKEKPTEWNMPPMQLLGVADLDHHLLLPDALALPEVEEGEEEDVEEEVGGFPHTWLMAAPPQNIRMSSSKRAVSSKKNQHREVGFVLLGDQCPLFMEAQHQVTHCVTETFVCCQLSVVYQRLLVSDRVLVTKEIIHCHQTAILPF